MVTESVHVRFGLIFFNQGILAGDRSVDSGITDISSPYFSSLYFSCAGSLVLSVPGSEVVYIHEIYKISSSMIRDPMMLIALNV